MRERTAGSGNVLEPCRGRCRCLLRELTCVASAVSGALRGRESRERGRHLPRDGGIHMFAGCDAVVRTGTAMRGSAAGSDHSKLREPGRHVRSAVVADTPAREGESNPNAERFPRVP